MSRTFFISDLHLGHKKILQFAGDYRDGDDVNEHNHILISKWNMVVGKWDKVFVLGDVVMGGPDNLYMLEELQGRIVLVRGNHDMRKAEVYLKYFSDVRGIFKYKGFWVTHCPIHPTELRGSRNIHGHVHQNSIRNHYGEIDDRYINVCVEACDGFPVAFEDIREGRYKMKC